MKVHIKDPRPIFHDLQNHTVADEENSVGGDVRLLFFICIYLVVLACNGNAAFI